MADWCIWRSAFSAFLLHLLTSSFFPPFLFHHQAKPLDQNLPLPIRLLLIRRKSLLVQPLNSLSLPLLSRPATISSCIWRFHSCRFGNSLPELQSWFWHRRSDSLCNRAPDQPVLFVRWTRTGQLRYIPRPRAYRHWLCCPNRGFYINLREMSKCGKSSVTGQILQRRGSELRVRPGLVLRLYPLCAEWLFE